MLIITGSYPPSVCGVGDYTARLLDTAVGRTKKWQLYHSTSWGIGTLIKHIKAINRTGKRVINMQYPTQGYGWSLVPHLLCIYYSWFTQRRFSVTLHEQSQLSRKARWAEKLILLTANRIIFTNEYERNYAIKHIPFIKSRSCVIKIFSNISAAEHIKSIADRSIDVVNFGHIRPFKGLEQFIDDVERAKYPVNAVIAGQVPPGFEDYFEQIEAKSKKVNIKICLNLSNSDVSALLNDAKIAYLPFPDGASERRGSLLASFANGAVVATTIGQFTTQKLYAAVVDIDKSSITDLMKNLKILEYKQQQALEFMKTQMPTSWDEVAEQYNNYLL